MAGEETEKICAECGHGIWEGWKSFTTDPVNPEKLLMKFGGHIRAPRKFRLPDDLGVFFHSSCAPEVGEKEGMNVPQALSFLAGFNFALEIGALQMKPAAKQEAARAMLKEVSHRLRAQTEQLPRDLVEKYSVVPITARRKRRARKSNERVVPGTE
jgi:hypothetical protein